jgi:hypothetical protein
MLLIVGLSIRSRWRSGSRLHWWYSMTCNLDALKQSFTGSLKNIVPFLVYGIGFVISIIATIPAGLGWLVGVQPWRRSIPRTETSSFRPRASSRHLRRVRAAFSPHMLDTAREIPRPA